MVSVFSVLLLLMNISLSLQNSLTYLYETVINPNRTDCMVALNTIFSDLSSMNNMFYLVANGKYLNGFGDYETCV